ncbi:MAG TPA: dephospho-CoA kinase [Acidimicrobiales bacterium]|nr:dephospho-CoA kinase [Acidimicrobiales bacterium]
MLVVGLTGGIGSGKSTVSALLAERGAVIIDADAVHRENMAPGGRVHDAVLGRFGTVDRPALAAIVFNDPDALRDLNALTHPAIGEVIVERLAAEADTDHVVVLDVPLLVESINPYPVAGLIVVDVPPDVAVQRLVQQRGMDEADARARMAAQATREQRLAAADFVIDNRGSLDELRAEVDRCWAWIRSL